MAALAVMLLPGLAWGPLQKQPPSHSTPREYVELQARQYGVPVPLAMAVWQMEASLRVKVPRGRAGERSAFQVTRDAALDMGCNWSRLDRFRVGVNCGMRYLARKIRECGRLTHAAHAYNTGHCPRKGKVWGYGQDVGRLMMKFR